MIMIKNKILITLHLLLMILAYTSWIWLDYRLVIIGAVGHLIMLEALRGCPLSHAQFPDDKNKRFYEWCLERIGVKLGETARVRLRIFMQYVLPFVIISLSLLTQIVLGVKPLISVNLFL